MLYKIEWIKQGTTTTGKPKADATLKGPDGVHIDVTIWGDFPDFVNLQNGGEVEGELKPASDPKYKPSLNAPRTPKMASGGGFKQKMIEDTMAKKNESISHFQASKEESIKISSTFGKAVDLAIAEYQVISRLSSTGPTLAELFEKWREFCWFAFEDVTKYPPFK